VQLPSTAELTPALSPTLAAIAALTPPRRLPRHYGTAVSPDGRFKLEIREGFQATLLQTPVVDQPPPRPIHFTQPQIRCASFAPDGNTFVAGLDSKARLYACTTGGMSFLGDAPAPIRSIMFSPDGSRVAAGCSDGSVIVWDVNTHEPSSILGPQNMPASCVRWSADGRQLAIGLGDSLDESERAILVICSAEQGNVLNQIQLSSPAGAIEWLDGERVLIADYDGQATIRRATDGAVVSQSSQPLPKDLKDAVSAAQWSPDCPRLNEILNTRAMP
jgi:WD40 repeat protein